jgi:two-component system CheB/CheR fusion protein
MLRARYAPPAVLVNEQGDIVYISGRTGRYLEPAAGKANWNIIAMAREGLRYDLTFALQKANRTSAAVVIRGIGLGHGDSGRVDVSVQALRNQSPGRGIEGQRQYQKADENVHPPRGSRARTAPRA